MGYGAAEATGLELFLLFVLLFSYFPILPCPPPQAIVDMDSDVGLLPQDSNLNTEVTQEPLEEDDLDLERDIVL